MLQRSRESRRSTVYLWEGIETEFNGETHALESPSVSSLHLNWSSSISVKNKKNSWIRRRSYSKKLIVWMKKLKRRFAEAFRRRTLYAEHTRPNINSTSNFWKFKWESECMQNRAWKWDMLWQLACKFYVLWNCFFERNKAPLSEGKAYLACEADVNGCAGDCSTIAPAAPSSASPVTSAPVLVASPAPVAASPVTPSPVESTQAPVTIVPVTTSPVTPAPVESTISPVTQWHA